MGVSGTIARVTRLRLVSCLAVSATLLASGCASGSAAMTGTLEVGNGACVWVRGAGANGDDLYWLRQLPPGFETDEHGLVRPDGSHIRIGDSLTVSGALSWVPFERDCGAKALDATAIG
jgi:hypothetical protein